MGKNVVVCLDGTGNQPSAHRASNVLKTYQLLELTNPSRQVAYYDPGVGTSGANGAWTPAGQRASRLLGLAAGWGLRENLGEAYSWLMNNYVEGDRLFVFGFSRGAYTARALTGMLRWVGLMRPGAENLVPYAVRLYTRRDDGAHQRWDDLHDFAASFSTPVDNRYGIPVDYVGLWDSVKAVGVLRWDPHWPNTAHLANVDTVRHALSIDERRRPYRPYFVVQKEGGPRRLDEVWFAGVHSDVGGGFPVLFPAEHRKTPVRRPILSDVPLRWVVRGAVEDGLLIDEKRLNRHYPAARSTALAERHRAPGIWALATFKTRAVPPGAHVHDSVRHLREQDASYRPLLPADLTWVDGDWAPEEVPASDRQPTDGTSPVGG